MLYEFLTSQRTAAVSIQLSLDYLPAPSDEAFEVGDIPLLWKIEWITIYFAMIVATNSLCTVLIVGRIIFLIGWRPALKTYRGIVTIILESALLYSGAFIIRIGMVTSLDEDSWNSSSLYVDALLPSITVRTTTRAISKHCINLCGSALPRLWLSFWYWQVTAPLLLHTSILQVLYRQRQFPKEHRTLECILRASIRVHLIWRGIWTSLTN